MDYIVTDETTSPLSLASQYSEKLAFMPHTFFIGDHANMFRHLTEKAVIVESQSRSNTDEPLTTVDNRSIVNGTNLKPILERSDVKVRGEKTSTNRFFLLQTITVKVSSADDENELGQRSAKKVKEEVVTPLVEVSQATVVHQLLQQGHCEVSINGIVAQNGATTLQVRSATFRFRSFSMRCCFFFFFR